MIITICGSMKFAKQMGQAKKFLEKKGHHVLVGPLVKQYLHGKIRYSKGKKGAELKMIHDLIRAHFKKIEKSDAILVLNYTKGRIKNYIGGNTLMEIGYAFYLDKKIYFLNPIPRQSYREEIVAMKPKILKGDLSKIK
jgi:nucleoside 2-deoxyribosyltransferase